MVAETAPDLLVPIHLTGAYSDRAEIAGVRDILSGHGIASVITPWIKEGVSDNAALSADPPPAMLFCWSSTSTSLDYAALHAVACRLQRDGRYMGVSLDSVAVPEGFDPKTLTDLKQLLITEGAGALAKLRPAPTGIRDPLRKPLQVVRGWKKWAVGIPTFVVLSATVPLFFGYQNGVENVCKASFLRVLCRELPGSGVPSRSEEAEWNGIAAGSDCKPFRDYLESNGPKAPYAAEARQRLDLSVPVSGERAATFEIFVPDFDQTPHNDRLRARLAAVAAGDVLANETCARNGSQFQGVISPGVFRPRGEARCSSTSDGWVCETGGVAECYFKVADASRSCPPPGH